MAFRFPRRLRSGFGHALGRCGKLVVLAGLATLPIGQSQAQIIIGGHSGPAVTVDNSVLDRLGPPRTLPQLFLGERGRTVPPAAHVATTHRPIAKTALRHRSAKRHVVAKRRVPTTHKVARVALPRAKAPVETASSLHRIIHLTPPGSRVAAAKPAPRPLASRPIVSHEDIALSAPTKPAVAALVAPAPMRTPAPKEPASSDVPTPPVTPQTVAREIAPPAPVEPPSQPAIAHAPAAEAMPAVATTTTAAPGVSAAANATPPAGISTATTVAAAAPGVAATAPAAPAIPPVQKAAATTIGNAASAVRFKPGATELAAGPEPALDAIAHRLIGNESLRVQLISHATGSSDEAMEARRISLARAIAVRRYLIDKGVASLRIDVRALGNHTDEGAATDQVDLLVVSQ